MSTIQQNCNQRTLFFSSLNNSTRYNPISPYPTFTKPELDMRRKAEILQYSQKMTKATKKQKWTILVKQSSLNKRRICTFPTRAIEVPSTSSDVPGPTMMLYTDPTIPLYMYNNVQNVNNELNKVAYNDLKQNWTVYSIPDVIIQNNTTTALANLVILNPAYSAYSFYLKTPISLSVSGIKQSVRALSTTKKIVSSVTNAALSVYFSNQEIVFMSLDVTNLSSLIISLDNTAEGFDAYRYVGHIMAENIELNTTPQYVYTFYLTIDMTYIQYDEFDNILMETNVNNITNVVLANLSDLTDPYYYSYTNCVVENPPLPITFLPLTIDGTSTGYSCSS